MKDLVAVGEKLGVTVDAKTAGALALSLQAMRDACKDEATSQVGGADPSHARFLLCWLLAAFVIVVAATSTCTAAHCSHTRVCVLVLAGAIPRAGPDAACHQAHAAGAVLLYHQPPRSPGLEALRTCSGALYTLHQPHQVRLRVCPGCGHQQQSVC